MATLTLTDFKTMLDGTGLPVYYARSVESSKTNKTSYIVYQVINQPNKQLADDTSFWKTDTIQVSLFTNDKDETLETSLENILKSNNIIYIVATEFYDPQSSMLIRVYEMELDRFQ